MRDLRDLRSSTPSSAVRGYEQQRRERQKQPRCECREQWHKRGAWCRRCGQRPRERITCERQARCRASRSGAGPALSNDGHQRERRPHSAASSTANSANDRPIDPAADRPTDTPTDLAAIAAGEPAAVADIYAS